MSFPYYGKHEPMRAWKVYAWGRHVDTVYFSAECDRWYVTACVEEEYGAGCVVAEDMAKEDDR